MTRGDPVARHRKAGLQLVRNQLVSGDLQLLNEVEIDRAAIAVDMNQAFIEPLLEQGLNSGRARPQQLTANSGRSALQESDRMRLCRRALFCFGPTIKLG
jgi:hypothetical protein